ncbi:hypothetical protein [Chelativorans composti]|uniref:Polysaccharide deacetylase n=1 Tax=Chelativorans composti TaxID=768533 RepID=A0ABW5DFT3_9HYPH
MVKTILQGGPVQWGWITLTCRDAFDVLYGDGEKSTRFYSLHIHPWMIGQPARFRFLEEVIRYIAGHIGVWNATAGEVAASIRRVP